MRSLYDFVLRGAEWLAAAAALVVALAVALRGLRWRRDQDHSHGRPGRGGPDPDVEAPPRRTGRRPSPGPPDDARPRRGPRDTDPRPSANAPIPPTRSARHRRRGRLLFRGRPADDGRPSRRPGAPAPSPRVREVDEATSERSVAVGGDAAGPTIGLDEGHVPREGRNAPELVSLHLRAQMDPGIVVDQVSTVQVLVSREIVRHAERLTNVGGQTTARTDQWLLVEVIGRMNIEVIGRDRVEVSVPPPNQPSVVLFDVRGTHLGAGEVWVVVRQGPLPLLTLVLKPEIWATAARSADPVRVEGEAAVGVPSEPLTVLRIVEQRLGDGVVFRYDLDAPTLGLLRVCASRPIQQDRDRYVRGLFNRIERAWLASARDREAFQAELRAFGGQLLDELIPIELQEDLWAHRDQLAHVVVLSTEPFIPWELVHLKAPGVQQLPAETRFLAQLGLVRWLWGTRPPEQLRLRPGRAHYVIPDYPDPDWRLGETGTERAFLEQNLGATPITAHQREVLALLEDPAGFDLLHFAGHGLATSDDIADAQVLLEGRVEQGEYVPEPLRATLVAQYFAAGPEDQDDTRPMVVLNACQTGRLGYQLASIGGFAEAFVGRGAGAFVSSLWSVGDTPARGFIEALYRALLDGQPMATAVKTAREAARRAGDATWLSYTVYAHPEARLGRVPAAVTDHYHP
jgi:hypothetical protein